MTNQFNSKFYAFNRVNTNKGKEIVEWFLCLYLTPAGPWIFITTETHEKDLKAYEKFILTPNQLQCADNKPGVGRICVLHH